VVALVLLTNSHGFCQTTGDPQEVSGVVATDQPSAPIPAAIAAQGLFATGIVFDDVNADGKFGDGDLPFAGVKVSNGLDIATTDVGGRYQLPITEDSIIFLIKPTGYRTALTKENLPKFFYIHKPAGSPQLQYPGSKPTGALPRSIDFPLYRQSEPDVFQVILFGDPQPRDLEEVDYIARDVVAELVGETSASFGISLGDLAFDHLETLIPLNQAVAMIGIPWYNVIGNHDLNLDATTREHVNETFEDIYGPTYYSFDYGQVHFVVLDNIDWENRPPEPAHYLANFGDRQLTWLEKDLSLIPDSQMVVLLMHVPIVDSNDSQRLFRLIEARPLCISISAHQHIQRHMFLGEDEGWQGKQPHHHIINVTVSGSWWSGQKDERGIPHTMMADGAPNGYSMITFDGNDYRFDYKAAGRPASDQMRIMMDYSIDTNQTENTEVSVNVYNGSEKSTVRMSVEGTGQWIELERRIENDPTFVEIYEREQATTPIPEPKLTKPKVSFHLWAAKLPPRLAPGFHQLNVETTDMHGRRYFAKRAFWVTDETNSVAQEPPVPETVDAQSGQN
jgi:hypothetical protein